MLDNEHIKLRAPEPEDLDFLYTIENDPELSTTTTATVRQKSAYSSIILTVGKAMPYKQSL